MEVRFSKDFEKAARRLSGKRLKSLISAIDEVRASSSVLSISDCKKLETFNSVYRIRVGSYRAFFVLHIRIEGDMVIFEYLLPRGEAYGKKSLDRLRNRDV